PQGWTYKAFPDVKKASISELATLIKSASAVARFYASQELITRPIEQASEISLEITSDKSLPLYTRVAGLYTYAQIAGEKAIPALVELTEEDIMREFALRALTDRKAYLKDVP